ncbi:class I SAM-dependent methyltransferase [Streptomyces phaeochromogenes]|uniref:class I SAM-dependent methyltransferase n=1 Tax=Streptomyces phaeochromogenes TaxID=1923 RepID=UPI0038684FAC|nr:class I SAM-dependent methyltransferase [Streptomyces phaeochromogenes]
MVGPFFAPAAPTLPHSRLRSSGGPPPSLTQGLRPRTPAAQFPAPLLGARGTARPATTALAGLGYRTLAVDWADASVAAVRDRYADVEPRIAVRRLDFEDDLAVRDQLPSNSFHLVTMRLVLAFLTDRSGAAERVRRLLVPGGVWVVTTPLAARLPDERRSIGMTAQDVADLIDGCGRGSWYDLEPGGVRCLVLRK